MKIAICIAALAALVGTCYHSKTPDMLAASASMIDYQVDDNKYAIVIALDSNVSEADARKLGRQRAAEITVDHGSRYFSIQSESRVQMVKSSGEWPDQNAFYGNMYQELIVEGDFSKQQVSGEGQQTAQVVPALRMMIIVYPNKSGSGALDACKYTECH